VGHRRIRTVGGWFYDNHDNYNQQYGNGQHYINEHDDFDYGDGFNDFFKLNDNIDYYFIYNQHRYCFYDIIKHKQFHEYVNIDADYRSRRNDFDLNYDNDYDNDYGYCFDHKFHDIDNYINGEFNEHNDFHSDSQYDFEQYVNNGNGDNSNVFVNEHEHYNNGIYRPL